MSKNNNHLSFRSGNPALNSKTFENFNITQEKTMTLQGTVNKTIFREMICFNLSPYIDIGIFLFFLKLLKVFQKRGFFHLQYQRIMKPQIQILMDVA